MIIPRAAAAATTFLLLAFPALAQEAFGPTSGNSMGGSGGSGSFSAPEIEIALVSSALLVAGGAALILKDRRARRKLDDPE